MAKIIKIGSQNTTLTSKTANLGKTSRQGNSTNPFKFSNFEGNTLQFADVFEGFEPKKQNKLRMIASSVTGSMNKMRSSITEPIVNFVNRVRGGISNAWDYAKNTNVSDLPGIKQFNDVMNTPVNLDGLKAIGRGISSKMEFLNTDIVDIGKGISDGLGRSLSAPIELLNTDIVDVGKGISSKMGILNRDITDIGKDLSESWNSLISKVHTEKYSKEMPVSDLENAWLNEIANESMEGARA